MYSKFLKLSVKTFILLGFILFLGCETKKAITIIDTAKITVPPQVEQSKNPTTSSLNVSETPSNISLSSLPTPTNSNSTVLVSNYPISPSPTQYPSVSPSNTSSNLGSTYIYPTGDVVIDVNTNKPTVSP